MTLFYRWQIFDPEMCEFLKVSHLSGVFRLNWNSTDKSISPLSWMTRKHCFDFFGVQSRFIGHMLGMYLHRYVCVPMCVFSTCIYTHTVGRGGIRVQFCIGLVPNFNLAHLLISFIPLAEVIPRANSYKHCLAQAICL